MCVAIPSKIVEIDETTATVAVGGSRILARLDLVEGAKVGDYVLVHAGFAITLLDAEDARETLSLMKEVGIV